MNSQQSLDLLPTVGVAESAADGSSLWWKIQALADISDQLFVKKLSRNDTSWADDAGKHQAGFYVPHHIRTAGFFPTLVADNPDKPHIFRANCDVLWPQTGETTHSNIRHYSNKGSEAHFTRLPKPLFQSLTPASLLLTGRFKHQTAGCHYWIVVLDSASEEAELLETVFDLRSDFHYRLFDATCFADAAQLQKDEKQELIDRLQHAIRTGSIETILREYGIPEPADIATEARESWLQARGLDSLDPWSLPNPGDAIMAISRDVEFSLYRRYELRRRAAELLAIVANGNDLVTRIVHRFADIDRVFLSASQQRKTRAGRSFEYHIANCFAAGRIRFVEQAVTGGRRPDFVMPDLKTLRDRKRNSLDALVLAAKTTLRERWKQVSSERLNCEVFLATVDDRVAINSIREMADAGIQLVVPE